MPPSLLVPQQCWVGTGPCCIVKAKGRLCLVLPGDRAKQRIFPGHPVSGAAKYRARQPCDPISGADGVWTPEGWERSTSRRGKDAPRTVRVPPHRQSRRRGTLQGRCMAGEPGSPGAMTGCGQACVQWPEGPCSLRWKAAGLSSFHSSSKAGLPRRGVLHVFVKPAQHLVNKLLVRLHCGIPMRLMRQNHQARRAPIASNGFVKLL